MDRLTKHVSFKEATRTSRKLDNTPNANQLKNMIALCENIFEPLRVWAGEPIKINSMFRSPAVNVAIGGAKNSQHTANNGSAMDIDATDKKTNADLFNYIRENLPFDQLIWEFGNDKNPDWIHVSYCTHRANRKQVLKAVKIGSVTKYLKF
jgi:hypothetical protein